MSELFDKEVNAQKESLKKTFRVYTSSHKPTKKCVMKMKPRKKQHTHKNVIDGRKPFIRPGKTISTSFESTILDTMKVVFV